MVVAFRGYMYEPEQGKWLDVDTDDNARMLARSPDGLFLCQKTKAASDVVVDHHVEAARNSHSLVSGKKRTKKRKLDEGASDKKSEPDTKRKKADPRTVQHDHMVGNPLTNEWKMLPPLNTRLVPTWYVNREGGSYVADVDEYVEDMVMVTGTASVVALLMEIDKKDKPWVTPALCSIEGQAGWQLKTRRKLGTSSVSQMRRTLSSCSLHMKDILFHAIRPGCLIAYNVVDDKAVYAEVGIPDFDTQFPAWTVARQGQVYMFGSLWETQARKTDVLSGEFYEHKRLAAWKVNWKAAGWDMVSATTHSEMEAALKDSTGYAFVFVKDGDCIKLMIKGSKTALTFDFDKKAWGTVDLGCTFEADPSFDIHENKPLRSSCTSQ